MTVLNNDQMMRSNRKLYLTCHWTWILALMAIGHTLAGIQLEGLDMTSVLMLGIFVIGGWVLRTMSLFYEREGWKRWR